MKNTLKMLGTSALLFFAGKGLLAQNASTVVESSEQLVMDSLQFSKQPDDTKEFGDISVKKTFAGVVTGQEIGREGESALSLRAGGLAHMYLSKEAGLNVLMFGDVNTSNSLRVVAPFIRMQLFKNLSVTAGKIPTSAAIKRPSPISAGGHFEAPNSASLPGLGWGGRLDGTVGSVAGSFSYVDRGERGQSKPELTSSFSFPFGELSFDAVGVYAEEKLQGALKTTYNNLAIFTVFTKSENAGNSLGCDAYWYTELDTKKLLHVYVVGTYGFDQQLLSGEVGTGISNEINAGGIKSLTVWGAASIGSDEGGGISVTPKVYVSMEFGGEKTK